MNQNKPDQRNPIKFLNKSDSQNLQPAMEYINQVPPNYSTSNIQNTLAMKIKESARIPYDYPFNDFHFSRTKEGWIKLEVIIDFPDRRKVYSMKTDGIYYFDTREVVMMHYPNIEERNIQIQKLYKKQDMTQVFLGKIFGLHQTTISGIINSKPKESIEPLRIRIK